MPAPLLPRATLSRVLGSLVRHELATSRGRGGGTQPTLLSPEWAEDLRLSDDRPGGFGCDSLELLQVGAAVNEMFHLHEAGEATDLLGDDHVGFWLDHIAAAWETGVASVTFSTSGSTGLPRPCTHPIEHLRLEGQYLAELFGDRRRVLSFAPPHHIYGFLFGALLPSILGVEVVAAERFGAAEFARTIRPGDLVIGFPERWAWMARSLPSWPGDVWGTTSTAPCPADLIASLTARGLARMVEIYGSSETAGLGVRTAPAACFGLMPHWRRDPADDDAAPRLRHAAGMSVDLPDDVVWHDERHFTVERRRDGAVQVGGLNVYPSSIAERLSRRPGVAEVSIRLMRRDEGRRLKAFVVAEPASDRAMLEIELRRWVAAHLRAAERPTSFTFGDRLPTSALGKSADW